MGHRADAPVPVASLTFAEGRYFDLWMLVHGLSGLAGGLSNVYFGLRPATVYALGLGLMLAWEGVELAASIREAWQNRVLDLAYGAVGIALALGLLARLERGAAIAAFWVALAVFAVGDVAGWLAYRRRRAREAAVGGTA